MSSRDEVASEEPLSVQLRRDFWNDHSQWWRIPGGGIAPRDRDDLMKMLSEEEALAGDAKAEYEKRATAVTKARKAFDTASSEYHGQQRRVDVLKLALAEAIGIPK